MYAGYGASRNPQKGSEASSLRAETDGHGEYMCCPCHWAFLGASDGDTLLDHDVDQKILDDEAQLLVSLPPTEFAGFMLTMLFTKVLYPKGVRNMTVVVDGSVINIGDGEFLTALKQAKTALSGEIARCQGTSNV